MELRNNFTKIKIRIRELWEYNIFRYTVIIHGFYFVISVILTLSVFRERNDFLVYYEVGKVFTTDINNLYSADYLWPFRYFPISAIFFVPFYLLGFELGLILFNLLNLILNLLISILLYKIIILIKGEGHKKEENRVILYICLFLLSLPNLFNYILGQINLYITFLVLLSLFLFLKFESIKWEFVASVILGLSIIIKPVTIFMIPFLVIINFNWKTKKFVLSPFRSTIKIVGALVPLLLNLFIFVPYPQLFEGFLMINFTGSEPIILNHSFSLSKLIVNFCIFYNIAYNPLLILMILFLFFGILSFAIYMFRRKLENSIVYGYIFGILIMLLVYFDSWPHHLLILTPMLIILIFLLPRNSDIVKKYIKPSFIFLSFCDLVFMGIWFLLQAFFPFNFVSTIFLILTFYGVSKNLLKENT